jgi:pyridinium-3,5-biscarboxylic acid mononucleotide synthase
MDKREIAKVLEAHLRGEISTISASDSIEKLSFEDVGFAKIDHSRQSRQGFPEVVFGQGKTPIQIATIFEKLIDRSPNVLITRTNEATYQGLRALNNAIEWHESAKMIRLWRDKNDLGQGEISIVTAGTSDIPVAEEAALTAESMGNSVKRIWDAGVAGIHRILSERESLQDSRVVVVVAGMEGALPSVVGGLVKVPVIAVPTSIGYGASFNGLAALLGMLNSCSSNVSVVNIDNGFGGGFVASLINRKWENPQK